MLVVNALRSKITTADIISMSSVSDRIPEADVALYNSSKAALTAYTNALARDLKEARVWTLLPDYVETPMQHGTSDGNAEFDWSATIKPDEIAAFVGGLISGKYEAPSGSNIIIVTEKLKQDLTSVEVLYGFNTDTKELVRL